MDALLMCGGRGTRFEADREKPLYPVAGEPMVDRVRRALANGRVETTYAVVSPNAPETREYIVSAGCPRIETPGEGYVDDLGVALADARIEPPVCTVAADLAALSAPVVDRVLAAYGDVRPPEGSDAPPAPSMTVCVPVTLKRRLGVAVDSRLPDDDHLAPTGLNVVGASESQQVTHVSYDPRLAINVNRREDVAVAEALCA